MENVYDEKVQARIYQEFSNSKGEGAICYLDHAGATLYSEIQIKNIFNDLLGNVYGNPHSLNHSSKQTSDLIDQVRRRILKHFHTTSEEYSVIFTSGATAAIKLLLENFDWDASQSEEETFFDSETHFFNDEPPGAFVYTQVNHSSVIGGREIAKENRIPFFCLDQEEVSSLINVDISPGKKIIPRSNSLFAYPAQCNFSGRKYPLDWIKKIQNGVLDSYALENKTRNSKWFCLLDAACYCSTNDLDLSKIQPDFVSISFYKIFGYPTGLGALLVRNSSAYVLKKAYFGGGTVEIVLPFQNYHKKRKIIHERFEEGTVSYLSIIALEHGLNTLSRLNLTMNLISRHVFELARYAVKKLKALTHWNGTPLVELYTDSSYNDIKEQGGIVNFNLKRSNREYIGFVEVLHMANLRKIYIRTGCFCNLGACQRYLKLSDADLKRHFQAGHVCGDAKDLIEGRPTGSVRVSFGYMTTQNEVDCLVDFVKECFQEVVPQPTPNKKINFGIKSLKLSKILLFPIKSCGAMEVDSWTLNDKGLEYDREWMVTTGSGVCLSQKQIPTLCMIRPKINLKSQSLTLTFGTDENAITIPIKSDSNENKYDLCESKICNNLIYAHDCGDEVSDWLSNNLNTRGVRLVKQAKDNTRLKNKNKNEKNENENAVKLSFANQAQFLLINNESVRWLQELIGPDSDINFDSFLYRFRGNFYVDGAAEFSENKWKNLSIGSVNFRVEGPCGRCQMICIDQNTGKVNRKPLVTLSRALSGKLQFGIYLSQICTENLAIISVGDSVLVETN